MNMQGFTAQNIHRQSGAILAVALIILLVMTLIGITSMQSTTLEERMAGNQREQQLAFQAAESALRAGENDADGLANITGFSSTGVGGYYSQGADDDPLADASWAAGVSKAASGISGVKTQPRYYIKHIGYIERDEPLLNMGPGYPAPGSTGDVTVLSITARGTGATDNSRAIVREHYGVAGL